jgi:hypothetical protein
VFLLLCIFYLTFILRDLRKSLLILHYQTWFF